jgi:hypothetical protein
MDFRITIPFDVVSPGKMQELATGRVIRLKEVPMIGFCGPTVLVIGDSFTRGLIGIRFNMNWLHSKLRVDQMASFLNVWPGSNPVNDIPSLRVGVRNGLH